MPSDPARSRGLAFTSILSPLTAASAAVALLMTGCGSAAAPSPGPRPPEAVTTARDNANGTTVRLDVGDRLNLTLSSSYWNLHPRPAPAVLHQDGPTSLLPGPSTCPDIPGLGCTPAQTLFTALAPGTAVITATRTTCGEALRCAAVLTTHGYLSLVVDAKTFRVLDSGLSPEPPPVPPASLGPITYPIDRGH
ncbi:MAG TPA: hypothetical protein VMV17_14965 [Streptosporangiaceae bacterium]|nr:hypothetical protein [Streptosporangiaceae bacterium]